MPSSTRSSPPSARGKVWRSAWISRSASSAHEEVLNRSGTCVPRTVEWAPERPIDEDDEQAHHRDAEHDTVEVAGRRLLRDIRAEALRFEVRVAPARDLGDDAGVP